MVKLTRTGKRIKLGKGDHVVVVGDKEVTNERVQEVWINTGGSFDTMPLTTNIGQIPFKLPSAGRTQLLDESYRLWKFDALGGNIIRTTTYFTLGRGVVFNFDEKAAQFYAQKFYCKNRLEVKLRAASDEANAFGEVYIWLRPKFEEVRSGGKVIWRPGDTQVTFIPPYNITNVETDDSDVGDVHNFIYEWQNADMSDETMKLPHISKYDVEGENKRNGCVIQIKLNSGNLDAFGQGDLLPVKEWLDNYQEYLRDGVIINKLYRSPCYDVSIEDGTEEEVNAAISRYRGWSIGSNPVHNSREEWKILEFQGPSSSNQEARRALLLIIAAGVGFAEFMLADGSNSSLSSSKSQQLPVIKKFEDRQDLWAYTLMEMFQFALLTKARVARGSGLEIERDREGDFEPFAGRVGFPEISKERELEVSQANNLALENGYMSPRTAASRMNLDFDREMELVDNDVEQLKKLRKKLDDAGITIAIGGPLPEVAPEGSQAAGQGANGPNAKPSNKDGKRGGENDSRTSRNRSRQPGGSESVRS